MKKYIVRKILFVFICITWVALFTVPALCFSWNINYPTFIEVNADSTVTTIVTTDSEPLDLYVEFKGCFEESGGNYWTGHWTYEAQEVELPANNTTTNIFIFTIPYDIYVEYLAAGDGFQAQYYYFYVWATPDGTWGSRVGDQSGGSGGAWTTYDPAIDVTYPSIDKGLLLTTGIRMIRDKILPPLGQPDTWTAGEGLRISLIAKLDNAREMVGRGKFNAVRGMMGAFINELESNNQAAAWNKAGECVALAENIIEWIEEY